MILVRNVFQLKFGKSGEALTLWKEGAALLKKAGVSSTRLLVDNVATFYTLIVENSFAGFSDYENFHRLNASNDEWKKWYEKFVPLVESGRREIFNVVE